MFGPRPPSWAVELPVWLAERLSESGDRTAIIARPQALWLMPTAVLPFLLVVLRRTLVDAPAPQIVLQLLARLAVLLAAALALSQPSLRSPIRGKTVVYVVDVSDSIDDDQLAEARKLARIGLDQIVAEEEEDLDREDRTRLALVTYAGRAEVREVTSESKVDDVILRHEGDHLASDHAGALRLAAALVDPQTEGRVVLITDAGGSLAEREDLQTASREMQSQGITLHVRRFPPQGAGRRARRSGATCRRRCGSGRRSRWRSTCRPPPRVR